MAFALPRPTVPAELSRPLRQRPWMLVRENAGFRVYFGRALVGG